MVDKKLQVFISSTYLDLKDERQVAVEAILGAGHIPAGMELFKAGNNSQLTTIKKWIDQSDVYMLILGGRYGSIEENSGKSYTQVEYEYALSKNIPVFAVILSDAMLERKANFEQNVFETNNLDKYMHFKEHVKTKMIKEINDTKDIKIAIYESLKELEEENVFSGWIPGTFLNKTFDMELYNDSSIESMSRKVDILNRKIMKIRIDAAYHKLKETIKIHYYSKDYLSSWEENVCDVNLLRLFLDYSVYLQKGYLSSYKAKRLLKHSIKNSVANNKYKYRDYQKKTVWVNRNSCEKILSYLVSINLIQPRKIDFFVESYKFTPLGKSMLKYLFDNLSLNI